MKKFSLHVGINDYPGTGADLNGCVNDAKNWTSLLEEEGYVATTLLDTDATKSMVVAHLKALIALARFGDRVVFTYSGHGSWLPDVGGDEEDGRDECLVLHDYATGGLLLDDEINEIVSGRRFGVRFYFFSDSCHSGSVSRFVNTTGRNLPHGVPRFLPPAAFLTGSELIAANAVKDVTPKGLSRNNGVLISGCADTEYSYDAYIDGIPQGAFSAAALKAYQKGITMRAWHRALNAGINKTFHPQNPQLQGSLWQRSWKL
jgi:hypothetical protein